MTHMWKEINEQPEVLERAIVSNRQVIETLVKAITSRSVQSVVIAGRGTSDHAAVYAKYLIELETGLPVALAAPSILTLYQRKLSLSNSLVIAISQSGQAADALEVLREGNRQGALTLSITNNTSSPLAEEARFHLDCSAGREQSVAATKTFTSQLFLLAHFVASWSGNKYLAEALSCVPEQIAQTVVGAGAVADRIERYRFMTECFVLARGVNYAIALEAALKIQETSYVRAKAYASADFYHGPFAMVEKDMPFIVFAPQGPSFQGMYELSQRLVKNEVELIVVSNDKDIMSMGHCAFPIPHTQNDIISPFLNVVVAQIFACKLSLAKGLNPDEPRGLKKVTVTK